MGRQRVPVTLPHKLRIGVRNHSAWHRYLLANPDIEALIVSMASSVRVPNEQVTFSTSKSSPLLEAMSRSQNFARGRFACSQLHICQSCHRRFPVRVRP